MRKKLCLTSIWFVSILFGRFPPNPIRTPSNRTRFSTKNSSVLGRARCAQSSDEGRVNDVLVFRENSLHGPTKWRFPITLGCPYANCGRDFRSREQAISHYRDAHFRGLTYCRICERPIGAKKFANHLLSQKHRLMRGGAERPQSECNAVSIERLHKNCHFLTLAQYFSAHARLCVRSAANRPLRSRFAPLHPTRAPTIRAAARTHSRSKPSDRRRSDRGAFRTPIVAR